MTLVNPDSTEITSMRNSPWSSDESLLDSPCEEEEEEEDELEVEDEEEDSTVK